MMKIITHTDELKSTPVVAGIGFFDGVHLGHRALISEIINAAHRDNMKSAVITFRTHPREVLHSDYCPQLISLEKEKLDLLSQSGIDYCILLDFTVKLSQLSACEFLKYINQNFGVKCLYIGYDHRFGHNRSEDFEDYIRYGKELGIKIFHAGEYSFHGKKISSSVIRHLLADGKINEANNLLGSIYTITGTVIHGNHIGHKIGFPTANLQTDPHKIIPSNGVYAIYATTTDGKRYRGVLNIGNRPTIEDNGKCSIEAHLFNFSKELYGQTLKIELIAFLRTERKMSGLQELTDQIKKDKEHAMNILL